MSRRAEILARLETRPGLTAFELRRVIGSRSTVDRVLRDMQLAGLVVPVLVFRPDQGRMVKLWHLAPEGTPPSPRAAAEQARKRVRDRESARRRRARAKGLPYPDAQRRYTLPRAAETPDLRGAACATEDPELFFSDDPASIIKAVGICAGCPVRTGCHEAAERNGEQHGVWAGMDRNAAHAELIAS